MRCRLEELCQTRRKFSLKFRKYGLPKRKLRRGLDMKGLEGFELDFHVPQSNKPNAGAPLSEPGADAK